MGTRDLPKLSTIKINLGPATKMKGSHSEQLGQSYKQKAEHKEQDIQGYGYIKLRTQ